MLTLNEKNVGLYDVIAHPVLTGVVAHVIQSQVPDIKGAVIEYLKQYQHNYQVN